MKLLSAAIVVLLFAMLLPAMALAAENGTNTNLTPVSISQNATISVPSASMVGLTKIGVFENATVYVSGGANATINGDRLAVDLGEAPRMDYRDVYLLYRLPAGFQSFSFDYDLSAGEKSNVLLIDFYNGTPKTGVKKGGIADRSVVGMGTWTNMGYNIGSISGLKPFAQDAHHIEVFPSDSMLYMRVDGNITAFNYYSWQQYLMVHLMVGDENSYLRGTISNLKYDGPAPGTAGNPTPGNSTDGISGLPAVTLKPGDNATGAGLNGSDDDEGAGEAVPDSGKPLMGLNIWIALAAGLAFFVAWAIVYFKYINK
ncbi:MAG: hypothetical protein WBZ29_04295 [Methanocella sp.]